MKKLDIRDLSRVICYSKFDDTELARRLRLNVSTIRLLRRGIKNVNPLIIPKLIKDIKELENE